MVCVSKQELQYAILSFKNSTLGGCRNDIEVKSTTILPEDMGVGPSTHRAAHSRL